MSGKLTLLIQILFLIFSRIFVSILVAPFWRRGILPLRILVLLALFLSYLIYSLMQHDIHLKESFSWAHLGILSVFNIEVGIFFGLMLSIFFSVFELVGEYWGFQMGFSMSKAYSHFSGDEVNVLSQIFVLITIYVFLELGGQLQFFDFLAHSFKTFPLLGESMNQDRAFITKIFSFVFKSGLEFALTVVGSILIANVFVGLLSKASPQINAMSFGLSVYTFLGFLLLWILVPMTLNSMVNYLHNIMNRIQTIFN